jgi:hypothetical protein
LKKELSKHALIKASEDYIKIFKYVSDLPNGTLIEYQHIREETGVDMNEYLNKQKLHHALQACGREYKTIPTVGYKLADGENATEIINTGIGKVANSFKKLKRTHINIKIDVYEEMPDEEKRRFIMTEAVTNTINDAISNSFKSLAVSKEIRQLTESKPIIP